MKYSPIVRRGIGAIALVLLLIFNTIALVSLGSVIFQRNLSMSVISQDADTFVLPDSNTRLYTEDEVQQLNDYDLTIAINEIYARHGLMFNDSDLVEHFTSQSWYVPTRTLADFEEGSLFNEVEQQNIITLATERERRSL